MLIEKETRILRGFWIWLGYFLHIGLHTNEKEVRDLLQHPLVLTNKKRTSHFLNQTV